jgi:transposase
MSDFFGLQVSEAVVLKACAQAKERLEPTVDAIAQALQHAPIVHADETGLRADKRLHWMHVQATPTLTWVGCHPKRGSQAFEEFQSLPAFKGTLIHDGWAPYRALPCTHGLCNAHHLALDMIELLTHAQQRTTQSGAPLPTVQLGHLRYVYDEILSHGERENPRASATGKRGRIKQSKTANLIARLRQYADDVLRFATDPGVPFTNNIAEQAVRMPKVGQKISGGFRTLEGAKIFCVIRSYLATMHKQGAHLLDALTEVFRGTVPQPWGVGAWVVTKKNNQTIVWLTECC